MSFQLDKKTIAILDALILESQKTLPKKQAKQVADFIKHYYIHAALEDLKQFNKLDLCGAAMSHWHLARQRMPSETKVHVYNPYFEKHGWQSAHTIIEIVTDDMPFLIDSVSMALNRRSLTNHFMIHPIIRSVRDNKGNLLQVHAQDSDQEGIAESLMQFQVERHSDADSIEDLRDEIVQIVVDVRKAVTDWDEMRQRVRAIIQALEQPKLPYVKDVVSEAAEYCRWIEADHFTLLGYCEYDLKTSRGQSDLQMRPGSELGIIRKSDGRTHLPASAILPTESQAYQQSKDLLTLAKANARSTIHRPAYMDFVGVKRFDANGKVIGEYCIVGLLTSAAYNRNTTDIPLLRQKVKRVMARSGLGERTHAGKSMQNIVETYPRDGLFQISEEDLLTHATGILKLQERPRIRLFVRHDNFGRYTACLVYVPLDRYSTELRIRVEDILVDAFNGHGVEFSTWFSESVIARIQIMVYTDPGLPPKYEISEIEEKVVEAARSWHDKLRDGILEQFGEEKASHLARKYGEAFPSGYRDDFPARTGAIDIKKIEATLESEQVAINFYRPLVETEGGVRLKLYSAGKPIPLTEALPMIENMGLKVYGERPYRIQPRETTPVWIHEFSMQSNKGHVIDPDKARDKFHEAFVQIWRGALENDGFNCLVLRADLNWRETVMLRAYCKYLKQTRIRYSETYMVSSLANNAELTNQLVQYFHQRFDPDLQSADKLTLSKQEVEIAASLDAVVNLDEDRILRSFQNAIQSTIRTNYYQLDKDNKPKSYLSFKVDSSKITRLPEPRPMFEIFVYSPRVEAVHLRGGRVARGGLRWSDRREDFRTEVLALVKAQMVKNAVIVPLGSKGGFVVKQPPEDDRTKLMEEVVSCYQCFMHGLLDLTDNLISGSVVPPPNVVRHDPDDPYLVIAADKGTATFSDIANDKALEYGYWLGDAFASGGSTGYDHKKMGITARGAWESVKRHFRELGINTQTQDFTVIGIGDMAGDVFGNGMLLSRHIRLLGAFNHKHVFLDPNPDPEASLNERQRLFKLDQSTWNDFDKKKISKGGGVFERSAKTIPLSPEIQQMLKVKVDKMTPNELIHKLLMAPADLLWNGGIGTYVKSQSETHDSVSDRANDAIRVNGNQLNCRVVGEGGNLGFTQLGRIEYSLNDGLMFTDSIDNSGGVDCSDHEVNIKILLDSIVANGDMTVKQRNQMLVEMTDEVSKLVIIDNYRQTQAISIGASRGSSLLQEQTRFIRMLERKEVLNRSLEFLPDDESLSERLAEHQGLTRPELAIVFSYSKMVLYEELLNSDVPEDPYLCNELSLYFPARLGKQFSEPMYNHPLRREIIATHITNSMVNRMGPTSAFRLSELTGASYPDIARAYAAAREIFEIRQMWIDIEQLDNKVSAQTQIEMMKDSGGLIERETLWLLRNRHAPIDIQSTVSHFQTGVKELVDSIPKALAAPNLAIHKHRVKRLLKQDVPNKLAEHVAGLVAMSSALDIVEVALAAKRSVPLTAELYFELGDQLDLHWLREQIAALSIQNHWHTLGKSSLRNDLHGLQRLLSTEVLNASSGNDRVKNMLKEWIKNNQAACNHYQHLMAELKASSSVDFAMLSVAISETQNLVRAVKLEQSTD